MTQMTATVGIKKDRKAAVDVLFKEFCQIDGNVVFDPVDASTLTRVQKREALRAVNLIKEKRDGKLKGRGCANGRPQREAYTKEETTSPTVSNDVLMLSLIIDTKECRGVATTDVKGAYLHTEMKDYVILHLVDEAADIMFRVDSKYIPFVVIEIGQKVLCLQLSKALYGCANSALLWYELFAGTLADLGFKLNPYDPCVTKCEITGKQCTVAWYVGDNKPLHLITQAIC